MTSGCLCAQSHGCWKNVCICSIVLGLTEPQTGGNIMLMYLHIQASSNLTLVMVIVRPSKKH